MTAKEQYSPEVHTYACALSALVEASISHVCATCTRICTHTCTHHAQVHALVWEAATERLHHAHEHAHTMHRYECPGHVAFDVVKDFAVEFGCGDEVNPGVKVPLLAAVLGCLERLHVDANTGRVRIAKKSLSNEVGMLLPRILNFLSNRNQCPTGEEILLDWQRSHTYDPQIDADAVEEQAPHDRHRGARRTPLQGTSNRDAETRTAFSFAADQMQDDADR